MQNDYLTDGELIELATSSDCVRVCSKSWQYLNSILDPKDRGCLGLMMSKVSGSMNTIMEQGHAYEDAGLRNYLKVGINRYRRLMNLLQSQSIVHYSKTSKGVGRTIHLSPFLVTEYGVVIEPACYGLFKEVKWAVGE